MEPFKAFRIFNDDGKISSRFVQMTLDELDPGEVVIRTEYSSVNYKDALAATGAGKVVRRFPCNGGIDAAGTVEQSTDSRFGEGNAVLVTSYDLGVSHDGGYARYLRVPADWVVPLPDGMTTQEAMVIGTAGFTAALAIERLEQNGLQPGQGPVVVTGATGGVGSLAVDLLAGRGYQVTAITGKDSEHEYLRALGANEVLSRHTLEMGRRPLERATWAGAIDTVGGEPLAWLTRTTAPWGSIAACGLAAGAELHTTVMPFILRGVNLLGVDSATCPMPLRRRIWERLATDLAPRHLDRIQQQIRFEQLPEVFDRFLQGTVRGRIVVEID